MNLEAGLNVRSISHIVARNSTFGLAAQLAIKVLSFGFSVLILRHLGAESYGQYAAVLAFGSLFVFAADLGMGTYLVREVARLRGNGEATSQIESMYGTVLRLRLVLSVIATALMLTTAWLSGRPLAMLGGIAIGALGLVVYSLQGTSDSVLSGFERLDLSAASKVLNQLVFVVLGAIALLLGLGYYGLMVANLLGVATMTYMCWRAVRYLRIRPSRFKAMPWLTLLRASMPFGIIGFTLGLSYKFDSVVLNISRGDAETGYYNAAYNLVFSAALLSNIFNTSLFPSLTHQVASSPRALSGIFQRSFGILMLLSMPIAFGACVLADQIVPFLFTSSYAASIPALQIVIWTVPLMFCSEFLGYVAVINGREGRVARAVMISTGTNVCVNLLLVPRFGYLAAATMTVITEAILAGQYLFMLREQLQDFDWSRLLVRPLLAAVGMGAVLMVVHSFWVPLAIAVGVLSYAVLLVLLRVIGIDELRLVRSLRMLTPPPSATPAPARQNLVSQAAIDPAA